MKTTKSYKLALMDAASIGARRASNAQLKSYESTGVVLKESETNDKSAPVLPDKEELKKTPIKKSVRKEMIQELRKRSLSADKDLRHVKSALIRDRSSPEIKPSEISSVEMKSKHKKRKDLLTEVKAKGARRLSNSQIKGFSFVDIILKDTQTNDKSKPVLPKSDELKGKITTKKNVRKDMVKEIRRRSLVTVSE